MLSTYVSLSFLSGTVNVHSWFWIYVSFICVGAELGVERIGDRVNWIIESGGLHPKERGYV